MGNSTEKQNNIREVKFVNEIVHFISQTNGAPKEIISLKAGPAYIADSLFSSEYPNEGEMEKALNYIEYELTKHEELKNNNELLVCASPVLAETLSVVKKGLIKRDALEVVFDKYVDCAFGEPAIHLGIDYSKEKLSYLMLVRSVLYYLNFDQIEISR